MIEQCDGSPLYIKKEILDFFDAKTFGWKSKSSITLLDLVFQTPGNVFFFFLNIISQSGEMNNIMPKNVQDLYA